MESIPEPIRGKLVGRMYDSLDKLPNEENMDRWKYVQKECGLVGAELNELMNIRFPVKQASVAPGADPAAVEQVNIGPLATFWGYIVYGKVEEGYYEPYSGMTFGDEGAARSVKIISFKGHDDDTHACATWGPSHSFSILVEREEYTRCWNLIQSKKLKFISLRGTKGIGKSVFIYWLIYKLVQVAKSPTGTSETTANLPTFLLITRDAKGGKLYQKLSVVDGVPVVRRVPSDVCADYVLSDVEYDIAAHTGNWNLNVMSYGARKKPDVFIGKVWDAGEGGLEIIMQPCSLEEIQAMCGPASAASATFSYAVFGGSARMARMLNTVITGGNKQVVDLVQRELVEYFAGTEYADSTALIRQAALLIAKMLAVSALKTEQMEYSHAAAVLHSLFVHTYLDEVDAQGEGTTRTEFASTFMSILAGTLVECDEFGVLKQLRSILTGSGQGGLLYKEHVHKTLYEKFKTGGDLRLTRIYPSGYQRKATDKDFEELRITVNKKVFIRTLEDIARMKENEFGLPMICSFPVYAVVKVGCNAGYDVELQVTIDEAHMGAVNKHQDIEKGMGTPSANTKIIFCCYWENFDSFKYVNGRVPEVNQYKMLCEWEANPGNPVKRRKTEDHTCK